MECSAVLPGMQARPARATRCAIACRSGIAARASSSAQAARTGVPGKCSAAYRSKRRWSLPPPTHPWPSTVQPSRSSSGATPSTMTHLDRPVVFQYPPS
jgi:hypothetical protein